MHGYCRIEGLLATINYVIIKMHFSHLILSKNRDQGVINNVGPFFRLFYQGLEKLPRTTLKASRAVKVKNIPRFRKLFQNPPNKGKYIFLWESNKNLYAKFLF